MKSEPKIKERPILFSAPMVRAILSGRKTMTRRIVSFVAGIGKVTCFSGDATDGYDFALRDRRDMWNELREDELLARCPYGQPGERLWVRETWGLFDTMPSDGPDGAHVFYRATDGDRRELRFQLWRPSIFMPRWASRIALDVTGVRVERLRSITEDDAVAEGAQCAGFPASLSNVGAFAKLWEKINGRESWADNPWVWVVEFTRVLEVPSGAGSKRGSVSVLRSEQP